MVSTPTLVHSIAKFLPIRKEVRVENTAIGGYWVVETHLYFGSDAHEFS
jgi:hypothetical protein